MINAYATKQAKKELEPFTYDEEVGPNDIVVNITHCGICHSDVHLVDGDWGDVFPVVPGHEIIGTIEKIGDSVSKHKIGDKVGVGWQCNSCNDCEYCTNNEETFCSQNQPTCMSHFGGFANQVVANERFVIPIPESMDSASAAPLLCGGATVFTPLKEYAKAGDSVAVIGIGGLGHLALQLAKALGCSVTALSTNSSKEEDAKSFGADEFVIGEPKANSFDVILNTAHVSPDMDIYMGALKPKGVFVQLGASPTPLQVGAFDLIRGNRKLVGSAIGQPSVISEMITLAHEKGIKAKVQVMKMDECNEAIDITRKNKARYRVVLEN